MAGFSSEPPWCLACVLLGASFFALPVQADIPVHCDAKNVGGSWQIQLTSPAPDRTSCSHQRPDSVTDQPSLLELSAQLTLHRELHLSVGDGVLNHGGLVVVEGADGEVGAQGNWTMVADEGFEVEFLHDALKLPGNSSGMLSLFAFSRYDLHDPNADGAKAKMGKKAIAAAGMVDWEKHSVSRCGETLLGWYSIGRTSWGCWRGQLKGKAPSPPKVLLSVSAETGSETPLTLIDLHAQVQRINAKKGTWVAKPYTRWLGKTKSELANLRGVRWHHRDMYQPTSFLARRTSLRSAPSSVVSSVAQANASIAVSAADAYYFAGVAEAEAKLPKTVDWTDARDGRNFLDPVMDQQDCGSCWAVAGMRMLTARHKIAQNDPDVLPWSISFPLYCSEYNQGCNGGYGFLIAKWSQDVGLVPATCARYDAHGKACNIDQACVTALSNGTRWRASNYRYMGVDNRGKTTTAAMLMQELHERGPIVVGLSGADIGDDFMMYAGGIYSGESDPPKDSSGGHAVILVGYGEEDGEKYWTVQNSWGPDWGEDGYVRLSRNMIKFRQGEIADVIPDEQKGRQVDRIVAQLATSANSHATA